MAEATGHGKKTLNDVKKEAEEAWSAWNATVRTVAAQAHDLLYHTKQLWHEEKEFWADARRKALRGTWSIAEFDSEMEYVQKKHAPVWCNLLKAQVDLREKLDGPYEQVKLANVHLKTALNEDPLAQKYMHPLSHQLFGKAWHADQIDLHHYYASKWMHQFKDVQQEFEALAGHPSGTLSRVKNMGNHSITEHEELVEEVHKKKKVETLVPPPTATLIEPPLHK
jgi:prophage DNA circulation protein